MQWRQRDTAWLVKETQTNIVKGDEIDNTLESSLEIFVFVLLLLIYKTTFLKRTQIEVLALYSEVQFPAKISFPHNVSLERLTAQQIDIAEGGISLHHKTVCLSMQDSDLFFSLIE